jgi:hypothetical protein
METNLIVGACGDVCSECPRYSLTLADDLKGLEKLSELWYRVGFRDKIISPGELKCCGCRKENPCTTKINICDHLVEKTNCGECDLFPCEKINIAFQKAEDLKDICKTRCTDSEYQLLSRAFLNKKQILTEINRNYKNIIK